MPCTSPNTAYWSVKHGDAGKRLVTFDRREAFSGVPLRLPCGKCPDCRLKYAAHWAVRGVHELRLHDKSEFVTLTYDDDNLPVEDGFPTLRMRDQQLFMKRLRKVYGAGVRFMCAGEYGGRFERPHYHFILYNFSPEDKRFYKETPRGDKLYKSEILRRLWPMGDNVVGDVSFQSISYVARYIVGKDEHPDEWYGPREVEFFNKSLRPGIGLRAFEEHKDEWYRHDSVVIDGHEFPPPRYYDVKYALYDADRMELLKRNRLRRALAKQFDDRRANNAFVDRKSGRVYKTTLDYDRRRRMVRELVLRKKAETFGRKEV